MKRREHFFYIIIIITATATTTAATATATTATATTTSVVSLVRVRIDTKSFCCVCCSCCLCGPWPVRTGVRRCSGCLELLALRVSNIDPFSGKMLRSTRSISINCIFCQTEGSNKIIEHGLKVSARQCVIGKPRYNEITRREPEEDLIPLRLPPHRNTTIRARAVLALHGYHQTPCISFKIVFHIRGGWGAKKEIAVVSEERQEHGQKYVYLRMYPYTTS